MLAIKPIMSFDKIHTNRIIHGDCIEVLSQLPDACIDLVIADPPYNIMKNRNLTFTTRTDIVQDVEFDHFESYYEYLKFTEEWVALVAKKMKANATFYCFFANQNVTDIINIATKHGMIRKNVIVWIKTNPAPHVMKTNYLSAYESCVFMVKGFPVFNFTKQEEMHNVIIHPICSQEERLKDEDGNTLHPTQKPAAVYEKLILASSKPDMMVCDPFVGSGTTNRVCKKWQRYCIGIELEEKYVVTGQKSLENIIPETRQNIKKKTASLRDYSRKG